MTAGAVGAGAGAGAGAAASPGIVAAAVIPNAVATYCINGLADRATNAANLGSFAAIRAMAGIAVSTASIARGTPRANATPAKAGRAATSVPGAVS